MADERIKLGLDLGEVKRETADATKLMEGFKTSVATTADTFEVLDRSIDPVQQDMDRLVAEAIKATQAQKAMNVVFRETETRMVAVDAAGTRVIGQGGASGRGLMGISYAFQDFISVATGGGGIVRALGAVSNNIDQVAMAAGASAQKAAALSIGFTGMVAVLPLLIPALEAAWKAIAGPEGTKEAEARNKQLERQKELLEAATKAVKAQADELKKLRDLQSPEEAKREKQRAEALQTKFGDRGEREALIGEVAMGMITPEQRIARTETGQQLGAEAAFLRRQLAAEKDPVLRGDLQRQLQRIRQRQAAIAQSDQRERGQAEEMVAGAVIGGREEDVQGVLGRLPEGSRFRRAFAAQTSAEMIRNKRLAEQAKVGQDEDKESREQAKQEEQQATKDAQDDRKRIRDEQRRIEASDRRNAQAERIRQRDIRQAPVTQLEQATSQLSQNLGYGTPNAAQTNEMADAALRNINDGMNAQQAIWAAVMQKVQAINTATARANGQLNKMEKQTQSGLGN